MKFFIPLFIALLVIIPKADVQSQKINATIDTKVGFVTDLRDKGLLIKRQPTGYQTPTFYYYDQDLKLKWEKKSSGSFYQSDNQKTLFLVQKYRPIDGEPTIKNMLVSVVNYTGEQSGVVNVTIPPKMYIYQVFTSDSNLNVLYKKKSSFQKHKVGESEIIFWRTISPGLVFVDTEIAVSSPSFEKFDEPYNYWTFLGHSKNEIFFSAVYKIKDEGYKSELLTIGGDGKANIINVDAGSVSFSEKNRLFFVNSLSANKDKLTMTCISPEGEEQWVTEARLKTPLKKWDCGNSDNLTSQISTRNGYVAFLLVLNEGKGGAYSILYDEEDGDKLYEKHIDGEINQAKQKGAIGSGDSRFLRYFPSSKAHSIIEENEDSLIKTYAYYYGNFYYSIREETELLVLFMKNETLIYIF